jgi:uncharacterized SAM-binding protein YcdF (DUF218 family)
MDPDDITAYVDIDAPPTEPTAHVLFGTNQPFPIDIAASRYHQGLAPLIITTGGVNRHNGIIEGQEFRRALLARDVPAAVIRCEDRSANTWQNVEYALPFLREAAAAGLPTTAISKWYHLRTIYALSKYLPDTPAFYGLGFDPIYDGEAITRANWRLHAGGKRRVVREWQDISQRVAAGDLRPLTRNNGWRPSA